MGNKEIESALKEMFPKEMERNQARLCIDLIENNGGECISIEDGVGISFEFDGFYIDFTDDQIVFIGEEGDFAHLEVYYYTLLGYMMHMSMLSAGFRRSYIWETEESAEKFNESNRRTSRTRNRYCRYKP